MDIIQTMDVIVTKVQYMMTKNKELANHILDQLVIKSLTMDMHRCKESTSTRAISLNRIMALQANVDMRLQVEKARDTQAAEQASIQVRKGKLERAFSTHLKRLEAETQIAELQAESVNLAAKMLRAQSDENAEGKQLLEHVEKEKQQEMEKVEKEKLQEIQKKAKEEVMQKMEVTFAKVDVKIQKKLKDRRSVKERGPANDPESSPKT